MPLESLLADLLRPADAIAPADVDSWWATHSEARGDAPFDRAARAAARFDRLGWAFASGYTEALCALAPGLGDEPAALAVSEAGGNHPAAIEATLTPEGDGWRLTGTKTFVTLGTRARRLLVLAALPSDEARGNRTRPTRVPADLERGLVGRGMSSTMIRDPGRGATSLALVAIPAHRHGVTIQARPTLPFVPEIPHAEARFEDVRVEPDERLGGDGWADWVRPFRTVEDVHVHGAAVAMLIGVGARAGWAPEVLGRGAALIAALRGLAHADPSEPAVHIAVDGALAHVRAWADGLDWADAPADVAEAFRRDRPLWSVAADARRARLARAWERVRGA